MNQPNEQAVVESKTKGRAGARKVGKDDFTTALPPMTDSLGAIADHPDELVKSPHRFINR